MNRSPPDGDMAMVEALPSLQRLALAYCPRRAKETTLALFALDARLAGLVRSSREPMLAQLRLAWWREILSQPVDSWPAGEPLLARLKTWRGRSEALAGLADGWEAMTAPALDRHAVDALADARGATFRALAGLVGQECDAEPAFCMGRAWALADIAARLSRPGEVDMARALLTEQDWRGARLSRAMRPLVVLHGLAARSARRNGLDEAQPAAILTAMRLGLLGF